MALDWIDSEVQASLARHLAPVRSRIAQLVRIEQSRRLFSGIGWWLFAMALLLLTCCLVDDVWDRSGGTPQIVRLFMTFGQLAMGLYLAYRWIWQPLCEPISETRLAVSVESSVGGMDHELVTVLEYAHGSPPRAHESFLEELASKSAGRSLSAGWEGVLKQGRSRKAALFAALGLAPILLLLALFPGWMLTLLARQLGWDKEIPRRNHLVLPASLVLPEGEEGQVEVGAEPSDPGGVGRVVFQGKDGSVREWTLEENEPRVMRIGAEIGAGRIQAFVGYSRSEKMELVRLNRPVLGVNTASVQLPAWVGKRPDGSMWPGTTESGDLGGWNGSRASLVLESSVPLKEARLRVVRSESAGETSGTTGASREVPAREIPVELNADGTQFTAQLDLTDGDRLWQAEAVSRDGLKTRVPLRRTIDVWQPVAPRVELLPELMIPTTPGALFAGRNKAMALRQALEENEVEGIPVPLGGRFRVAYAAASRAGLGQVRMVYRINGATQWKVLPLPEVESKSANGEFIRELGVFARTPEDAEIPFFAMPATDPAITPGKLEGGGRFDFRIAPLKELKPGDRLEYAIEVEDRHQPPMVGRSVTRIKDVVNLEEFLAWWSRKEKEQEKLRELRLRQGKVFEGYFQGSRPNPPSR